jgi:hypothetical protein
MQRYETLRGSRQNWDNHWSEVSRLIWPAADDFITRRVSGERRSDQIYDSTGALALEKFSAALESLLTPRQQRWHGLKSSNDDLNEISEVKAYFEDATKILFRMRNSPRAGYYSQVSENYKNLGAFGNACTFIDEPADASGIRYMQCAIGDCYIAVNPARRVDTMFKEFRLTAKAAQQRWGVLEEMGEAELPPSVKTALQQPGKEFEELDFLHVVMPNLDYDPERKDGAGMAWVSYHISVSDRFLVSSGGYHEFPYIYSRYTVNSTEIYGRSPAMLVLSHIKMAQEIQKTFIRAGHKVVDPPLLVHDDGVIGHGSQSIRLQPGGINYGGVDAQGRQLIQPLQTGARLDITESMLEKERMVINDAFLVNLFRILVEAPHAQTATEILHRAQEKGQLLAPMVGRQQSEFLGPQIEREFMIAHRLGMLPAMPSVLIEAGDDYEIIYESPATRLQRSEELVATQRTIEGVMPYAQINPTILEKFDWEFIAELGQEVNGAPSDILKTREQYAQIIQQQQEQAAQQQGMAQIEQMAGNAGGIKQLQEMVDG